MMFLIDNMHVWLIFYNIYLFTTIIVSIEIDNELHIETYMYGTSLFWLKHLFWLNDWNWESENCLSRDMRNVRWYFWLKETKQGFGRYFLDRSASEVL